MTKKTFDCVQMKWEIQQKLMKEEDGLTAEERNRRAEKTVLEDSILGPWFRKVRTQCARPAVVAESTTAYTVNKRKSGHA